MTAYASVYVKLLLVLHRLTLVDSSQSCPSHRRWCQPREIAPQSFEIILRNLPHFVDDIMFGDLKSATV